MNDYIQAFKSYLKTIAGYLNPNRTVVDQDIDDIFQLDKIISQVLKMYPDISLYDILKFN